MSNEDIKEMTDVELMAAWTDLGDQVAAGRERLKAFSAEYQDRCMVEQATAALGSETLAKLQAMEPVSVASEEAVGAVGGTDEDGVSLDG